MEMEPAGENGAATGRWSRHPPPATGPARPPGPAQPGAALRLLRRPRPARGEPSPARRCPGRPAERPQRPPRRLPAGCSPAAPADPPLPPVAARPRPAPHAGLRWRGAARRGGESPTLPPLPSHPPRERCPAAGGPLPAAGGAGRPGRCDRRAAPRVPEPPPPCPPRGRPAPLSREPRAPPGPAPGTGLASRPRGAAAAPGGREGRGALPGGVGNGSRRCQERPPGRRLGRERVPAPERWGLQRAGPGRALPRARTAPPGARADKAALSSTL